MTTPDVRLSIRSGKGLGDNLYLQSIARHLVETGHRPIVCTSFPDLFRPLSGKVDVEPYRRDHVDRVAHYISRKRVPGTDQFVDCCINAGVGDRAELRLDWSPVNFPLLARLKAQGKPVVMVQLPRHPMGRADGYGADLLPDCTVIQRAIDRIGDRAFKVQVGQGEPLFRFSGIDLDLANATTVSDLLDVAYASDGALGYCSFIVPLAESLNKPTLLVWSRRGLRSSNSFVRAIVPEKIIHRPSTTRAVVDDAKEAELNGAVDAFCDAIRH